MIEHLSEYNRIESSVYKKDYTWYNYPLYNHQVFWPQFLSCNYSSCSVGHWTGFQTKILLWTKFVKFHPLHLFQFDLSKKSFQGLNNLKISSLQQSMFEDLNNLQSLDISGNDIHKIPSDSFHGLNNLYFLKLSRNKIR